MPRKKKEIILTQPQTPKGRHPFKVRLDHRTIITLYDREALAFWKKRYPRAEIIS